METFTGFVSVVAVLTVVFIVYVGGAAMVLSILGKLLPRRQNAKPISGASLAAS